MVRNVVLLSVDALRADHLSCYGYERDTSPVVEDIAADGLRYEWAYSASSHTREAVPAILTGRHPQDAVAPDFTLDADTIATHLADTHATAAFHSNPYVSRAYGFDRDFDTFDDDMYLGRNRLFALAQRALQKFVFNRGEYHARAEKINRRSLDWLDSLGADQPFFLWNHYMDPHGPYNPPGGSPYTDSTVSDTEAQHLYHRLIEGEGSPSDHDLAVDLYDGEIRYLDAQIGAFFDALDDRDLLTETLVIITADHGDLFDEYGMYGHPRYVHPELTRVPMILSGPAVESGVVPGPASTVDVVPTILEALDREGPTLPGRSLLEPAAERRSVFSSATAEGDDEGIRRFAIWEGRCGYRLSREIDGGDIVDESAVTAADVEPAKPDTQSLLDTLRTELMAHSETQLSDVDADDGAVDGQVEDRLQALGYR